MKRALVLVLLLAPLLGLVGVAAGEVVPDGRIAYNLLRGHRTGIFGVEERPPTPLGTTMDRYTECVAVTVGLGDPAGSSLIESAVVSPAYRGCRRAVARLEELDATGELAEAPLYLRYWHGYTVVTRPSLAIFGLAGARWVALGLLAASVAALGVSVKRAVGVLPAVTFVVPGLLTTDLMLGGLTIPHALGLGATFFGGWIAFAAVFSRPTWIVAALAAALAGTVMAYVDLLTTMPGSLAFAAVGATIAVVASGAGPAWWFTAAGVVGWGLGLVWMWVWKWVFAAVAVGPQRVVDDVRSQVEFRLAGEHEGISDSPVRGLTSNIEYWWDRPLTPLVVVAVLAVVVTVAVRNRHRLSGQVAVCGAIVVVPVVLWYLALSNHNQIHVWMTYRSIPLAFGALGALVLTAAAAPAPSARG